MKKTLSIKHGMHKICFGDIDEDYDVELEVTYNGEEAGLIYLNQNCIKKIKEHCEYLINKFNNDSK